MRRFTQLITTASIAVQVSIVAFAQGYSAEEAPAKMTTAPGFEVQLVAGEPMVRQPVAIEFDDRGRLWVIQYMQYPNPEGLTRVTVDRYSRTTYDRMPEPPPHGPKGADVVTILDDTNGDGRADTAKNFAEGLNLATGLAFGYGGVYVIQAPYLLFYPDKNGDDVPDSDPEVLVTGFGMEDAHSVANSLTWGPDGWLYGLQGSTVTANINGIEFQQGIWRFHPRTRAFELFAEGGGNMWGLDFDWRGHMLVSTNVGGFVVLHAVQGGYYWKQFSKHGALHNPYTYGFFEHVTHHNPQGGHVAVGNIIYEAGAYPPNFNGTLVAANLLSHNVYWHTIEPKGSTFETRHAGELMNSNDTWFAPSDMTLGPDGCLYVCDWNDKRTAHPDPDAEWDRTNGRVYRIAPANAARPGPIDLLSRPAAEYVELLDHPNKWFVRRALLRLYEARDESMQDALLARINNAALSPKQRLTAVFALNASNGIDDNAASRLLKHPLPEVRRWTVRILGDERRATKRSAKQMRQMAERDPDVHVRSQLASTAKRLPADMALPIAFALAQRDEDAADLHIPLLVWWAIEGHAPKNIETTFNHVRAQSGSNATVFKREILPRLIRRYAADGAPACDDACVRLLALADAWQLEDTLLAALDDGLQDREGKLAGPGAGTLFTSYAAANGESADAATFAPVSEELVHALHTAWQARPDDPARLRLAIRTGNTAAYDRARSMAFNAATESAQRVEMIRLLARFGKPDCVPDLLATVRRESNEPVQRAALEALRRMPDPGTPASLMETYFVSPEPTRKAIRETLFTRPEWSKVFLAAVENGQIKPEEILVDELRVLANHDDDALRAVVEKHWGAIRPGTPEEKLADMRRMNNELNHAKGDPTAGKVVYTENCAKCHVLFGEGVHVGPDLTQSNRMDREYLLASIVDPSLTVRKEYMQVIVTTTDGSTYNGLVAEKTPGSITLLNANNARQVIALDEIEELRETEVSLMPEGLITALKGDAIRDLFAYLQSPAPGSE